MNLQHIPTYTYTDYQQWKEDWELIGGHPYSLLPSPVMRHNKVQVAATAMAYNALKKNGAGYNCVVFSELDWRINEETVVRPDFMIVCGEPETDFLEFSPVLIMEVLSPSTRMKDRNIKFELYQKQGVRYYLMADYEQQTLEVFELIDNTYQEVQKNTFILEEGCSITLDVAALWA